MRWVRYLSVAVCLTVTPHVLEASTLDRDRDPVVMTGSDLPWFLGLSLDRLVGFRYQGGWAQIPVQIDERDMVDFGVVYNMGAVGIVTLAYTDPDTYAGADSDPALDGDDEVVFMAADAGAAAPPAAGIPTGVFGTTGVEVEISDPLDAGTGFVYLFESDGSLPQDAGVSYGAYTFDLLAGSYIPDYDTASGPNPENSEFVSALYRSHFSDRWICDELQVTVAGSSGIDILDRHKNMFGPGVCGRSEDTFSNGEGAFFANISGAVRSIRSYMGANSGPLTQRDHIFYQGRQDVITFLRVHAIPGVMDLYDYSPAASGMSYHNDLNLSGVVVDGSPDVVTTGAIEWEMVSGSQGSVIVTHSLETDIPGFAYTAYYSDDTTPSVTQCTGDAFEYATSGPWINQSIPNTDPSQASFNNLTSRRIVYYEAPGQTVADAAFRHDQATTPLDVTARALPTATTTTTVADSTTTTSQTSTTTSPASTTTTVTATTSTTTTTMRLPACPPLPDGACETAFTRGLVVVKEKFAGREKFSAKWMNGPALEQADFGNPLEAGGTAYHICLYGDAGTLAAEMTVDRAGDTCAGKDCWTSLGPPPPDSKGQGYKYKDRMLSSDGIQQIVMRGGGAGKSRFLARGKNNQRKDQVQLPTGAAAALNGSTSATVQLFGSDAPVCISMTLTNVIKNTEGQFKAKK